MARPPIEGSEDIYTPDHPLYPIYLEGREAGMEGLELLDSPYRNVAPKKAAAWEAGWQDESSWALNSTGR